MEDSQEVVDTLNPMKSGKWERTRQLPPHIASFGRSPLPLSLAAPLMSNSQPLEEMEKRVPGEEYPSCAWPRLVQIELHNFGNVGLMCVKYLLVICSVNCFACCKLSRAKKDKVVTRCAKEREFGKLG